MTMLKSTFTQLCFFCGVLTGLAQTHTDTIGIGIFHDLEEIVIKGDLPNTRMKGNAMVTRIENTPLAQTGNADEMLVKVPGMTSGKSGLEVIGKGAPIIYINGRLVRDESELQRLRSDEIRDVEVINNPGAEYDATVQAVVRIRTKRQQGDGIGLNLTATMDQDLRYGFTTTNDKLSVNYRKGGLDIFGEAWYYIQDYRQYSSLKQVNNLEKKFTQTGPYTMTWEHRNIVSTGGVNYQITDNHSVGARVEIDHQMKGAKNKVIYDETIYEDDILIDHMYSEQTSKVDKPNAWLTNTYYNGKIGELSIDFNIDYMKKEDNTSRTNVETSEMENDIVASTSGAKSTLWAGKLVLAYPLGRGELRAGSEMSFVDRHNSYWIDKDNIDNSDADICENSYAAFADFAVDMEEAGRASAGIRYEHTLLKYDDMLGNDNLNRPTDDIFPSASYSKMFGRVEMALAYSAKTSRPNYFALNDAVTYISRYTLQAGNSKLKNETLHEVSYNASWKWLTFTAEYEHCKDAIIQWDYVTDGKVALVKHENLGTRINTWSAYLGLTPRAGVWSLNATLGVQKQFLSLTLDDIHAEGGKRTLTHNKPIWTVNAFNTWSLKNDWSFNLNVMFESKGHQQNIYNSYNVCRVGAVIQKSFMSKSLTVRAAVLDLLQRYRYNEFCDVGYHQIQQNNQYSRHKLNLALFYRFNNTRSKYKGSGAGVEAQRRMNG